MRIAVVYNARPDDFDRKDPELEQYIEGDEWKTIKAIGKALTGLGHKATYITVDENIFDKLKSAKSKVDLLFNLSEGISGISDREAQVPMLAELLRIPHTGPSPLSAALILNKYRTKQIWNAEGVPTPSAQLILTGKEKLDPRLSFPLIVKPNTDGSGVGIHNDSVVNNKAELKEALFRVLNKYRQPALVETFLPGREFTVSAIGNGDDLLVLPIVEINFSSFPKGSLPIDAYEAKFVYGVTGQADYKKTEFCPADIPEKLEREIIELSKKAYTVVGCVDFGRLDIRLDSRGRPYFLEINHPPGLMSEPEESSFFTISARAFGWDFPTLIGKIIDVASKRLNLQGA